MGLSSILRRDRLVLVSRVICAAAAIYDIFFGDFIVGIYILAALIAISAPAIATRNYVTYLPIGFELLFLAMVIIQFVIGETLSFYRLVPYYDKFVHFVLPSLLGIMGFLVAYTLYKTRKLRITKLTLVILIVLITLGIGAFWEIIEYLYDVNIAIKFHTVILQGNSYETPLADTMTDLIMDMVGGLFGAAIGLQYIITEKKRNNSKLYKLFREIASNFKEDKDWRKYKKRSLD